MIYRISERIANPAYLCVFAIVIASIVFIIVGMVIQYRRVSGSGGLIIQDLTQPCDIIESSNPDITNLNCCRDIDGHITDRKYIPDFDMIVSNVPRPYLTVCAGFCLQGLESDQKTCTSTGTDVSAQQSKFNKCISLTKPIDCSGEVKPVAYQGTTRYYAYAAGKSLCQNTGLCSQL